MEHKVVQITNCYWIAHVVVNLIPERFYLLPKMFNFL